MKALRESRGWIWTGLKDPPLLFFPCVHDPPWSSSPTGAGTAAGRGFGGGGPSPRPLARPTELTIRSFTVDGCRALGLHRRWIRTAPPEQALTADGISPTPLFCRTSLVVAHPAHPLVENKAIAATGRRNLYQASPLYKSVGGNGGGGYVATVM